MVLKQDFKDLDRILNNDEYSKNNILELKSILYGYIISSCHILDDTIFLANRRSLTDPTPHLIALDSRTLEKKWQFNYKDGEIGSGNIVNDSNLLYFGDEKFLHALDIRTGDEKFKFEYPNMCKRDDTVMIGRTGIDDKFLYLADYKQVYAIDLKTNLVKWEFPPKDIEDFNVFPCYELVGLPMVDDGNVCLVFENRKICSLDRNNGKERWKYEMQDKRFKRSALADNFELTFECLTSPRSPTFNKKHIILGDEENVYSLDADNGKLKWTFPIKKNGKIELHCEDDNVFLSDSANLYILGNSKGEERLRIPYKNWITSMVTDDKYLYVSSNGDGRLNLYDKNNLKEKLEIKLDSTIFSILIRKKVAYINTCNNLYVFNIK